VIATWLGALERLILPPACLLCGAAGAPGRDLCAACTNDLPRNQAACPRCAVPLPPGWTGSCERCRAQPPDFDRAFVPFRYQPPVDFLITRLKFSGRLAHARLLGELFAAALANRGDPSPDCIVPVPLHPRRLRERGFNQALELARAAARCFQIPLRANGLRRVRYTLPQIGLNAHQRQTNPLGAFALAAPLLGARVALMDDVITTGSTIGECARVLRAGGATDIEIWAIGRAGGDS
jgi:ComF family protein